MARRMARLLIVLMVFANAATVFGADEKITVVVDDSYPPYSYGTAQRVGGLYVELLEVIFSRMGSGVEIRALPWEEALQAGEEGRAAVAGIYKNSARLKIYDYSEPLAEERLAVYVRKAEAFDFDRLSDLQGKLVGLNRGWSYGEAFDDARDRYRFTVVESDSNLANFKKLISREIDCLVADQVAASQIIRRQNWGDRVERLEKPAAVNGAYLAVAKHLERRNLLEEFNRALADMKRDGSYARLVQDYVAGGGE